MDESCTVYRTFDIIGKKWSLLIILSIYKSDGRRQYSSIKKDLNSITPKILSQRLRELETENIIKKETDKSKVPINTFYSLTESGKDLVKIIHDIKSWGLKWKFDDLECKSTFCKHCRL